jgi:choline monooxygenase
MVRRPGAVCPLLLLEGCLDEPLVLTRDTGGVLHCLSNVCTHRGNLVVEQPGSVQSLRCRYHGRRFGLDGRFLSMPEFEGVHGFPSSADDLGRPASGTWGPFVFASLRPGFALETLLAPLQRRLAWLDVNALVHDPQRSRNYELPANWALYCDNYLEGFHIPFVHASLNEGLDWCRYRTELFEHGSLQVGIAKPGEEAFDLPPGSPDHGQRVAGYYFWLFPNLMFNFYPWGLSINVVQPLGVDRTRVSFLAYVGNASRLDRGAGGALDRVEREDEEIVAAVQRGVRSRLYGRGRYAPERELGVHHFHRLLVAFLATSRRGP